MNPSNPLSPIKAPHQTNPSKPAATAMLLLGLTLALICASTQAADPAILPNVAVPLNTPPSGFITLFNGKDLSGWRGRQPNYSPYDQAKLSAAQLSARQTTWNTD